MKTNGKASEITLLDIFNHMIDNSITSVNFDFDYDDLPLQIQCKLTSRNED